MIIYHLSQGTKSLTSDLLPKVETQIVAETPIVP